MTTNFTFCTIEIHAQSYLYRLWKHRFSCPVPVDLDNDGIKEFVVGEAGGTLYYIKKINGNWQTFSNYWGIDVGGYSYPTFADLNNDGLLDMVVGNYAGLVQYFVNNGTSTYIQNWRNRCL